MFNIGGGPSGGGAQKVNVWNKEQKELWQKYVYPFVRGGFEADVPKYPGQMWVGRTPEEQEFFSSLEGIPKDLEGRRAALRQVLSGQVPYEVGPEFAERYFEEGIRPKAMREWEEFTLPSIRGAYAGPGYWSSARAEAETRGAERLGETLAGQKSALAYGEELARRQAIEQALGRQAAVAPGLYTTELEALGTAGQYARMIEEEKAAADFQRWLAGETVVGPDGEEISPTMYNPWLDRALQLLGLKQYAVGPGPTSGGFSFGFNPFGQGGIQGAAKMFGLI